MSQTSEKSARRAPIRAAVALAVFLAIIVVVFLLDPDNALMWVKAFHIMAVIAWMAGLFYLPRLFIYHHESQPGSETSNLFKVMERRLYGIIMRPAMVITWVFGLYLAWEGFGFHGGWLHAKIALVVIMSGVHDHFGKAVAAFGRDERPKTARYWRLMNEAPTLLMIIIVLLVVLKPF